jgi:hypothetical protein
MMHFTAFLGTSLNPGMRDIKDIGDIEGIQIYEIQKI